MVALALSFVWLRCVASPACSWSISHTNKCDALWLEDCTRVASHPPPQCFKFQAHHQTQSDPPPSCLSGGIVSCAIPIICECSACLSCFEFQTRPKYSRAFSVKIMEVKNETDRRDGGEEPVHPDQLSSAASPEPNIAQTPCLLRLPEGAFSENALPSEVRSALTGEFIMLLKQCLGGNTGSPQACFRGIRTTLLSP